MPAPKKYPDEVRERAVRMMFEIREESGQHQGAIARVADRLGVNRETLGGLSSPGSPIMYARSRSSGTRRSPPDKRRRNGDGRPIHAAMETGSVEPVKVIHPLPFGGSFTLQWRPARWSRAGWLRRCGR